MLSTVAICVPAWGLKPEEMKKHTVSAARNAPPRPDESSHPDASSKGLIIIFVVPRRLDVGYAKRWRATHYAIVNINVLSVITNVNMLLSETVEKFVLLLAY